MDEQLVKVIAILISLKGASLDMDPQLRSIFWMERVEVNSRIPLPILRGFIGLTYSTALSI